PPEVVTVGFLMKGRICVDDPDGDEVTIDLEPVCVTSSYPNGNDNPWLAGMPVATMLAGDEVVSIDEPRTEPSPNRDTTPDQNEAPERVDFPCGLRAGDVLTFSATGSSSFGGGLPSQPTDGGASA